MLARFLDPDTDDRVRRHLGPLVVARLASNSCYRFVPPFIATIAADFDVSVSRVGIAVTVGEAAGLLAPIVGRAVDALSRRTAILLGAWGVTAAVVLASTSPSIAVLAVAMFLFGVSKILLDSSTMAWIYDRVPYERRGAIVGIVETTWALGLLGGVLAMGLVTQVTSWRWGFGVGGAAAAAAAVVLVARMPGGEQAARSAVTVARTAVRGRALWVVASMFLLMFASQAVSVTFGPWLADDHGASDLTIAVIVFALGAGELVASITVSRRADRWGKERSVQIASIAMVPCALVLVVGRGLPVIGIAGLVAFIAAFEYAIVALLPVAANLVPGFTGAGLGAAVGAGTVGRAVGTPIATGLYDSAAWGVGAAASLAAVAALGAAATMGIWRRGLSGTGS